MPIWATRAAIWTPLIIAALLVGGYMYLHDPFARDGTELLQVPLSEEDPTLEQVGSLQYRGGLDIPRMGENIGGLSGLRWEAESGRLLAITDDARWVWITPVEQGGRLTGIANVEIGNLLGVDGEALEGKLEGDSESLTRSALGGWLVGFERDHRVWRYPELTAYPQDTALSPTTLFGTLDDNAGLEALAGDETEFLACIERPSGSEPANCILQFEGTDVLGRCDLSPPSALALLGGVPTDADALSDGTFVILFRSYSPNDGSGAAIVTLAGDGTRRELVTLRPPLTVDNFEGLAVREEAGRTFLYIVSDDNFSSSQRTLLIKFEVVTE